VGNGGVRARWVAGSPLVVRVYHPRKGGSIHLYEQKGGRLDCVSGQNLRWKKRNTGRKSVSAPMSDSNAGSLVEWRGGGRSSILMKKENAP